MKASVYNEMSKTAEGRKEVRNIMVSEIKERMNKIISLFPEKNRKAASEMMERGFNKINEIGNGSIFQFFAEDGISDNNFIRYIDSALSGKIN